MPTLIGVVTGLGTASLSLGGLALTTATGALTTAGAILSIGGSIVLNAALNSRGNKSQARDTSAQLREETEKPAYRVPYGYTRVSGTPAPCRIVGGVGYACYILSSRPSEGGFQLYLDNRLVEYTGDPYNFNAGGGATATNDPFGGGLLRFWFGKGSQTTPPVDITNEAPQSVERPDLFKTTDAWTGCTVCWIRFEYNKDGASDRWISAPPFCDVEGKWTKVYDLRDGVTRWSRNQALCTLDAALNSPIKPYTLDGVLIEQFKAQADIADELVTLKSGDTEPRYCVDGVLVWDSRELEDQLIPLYMAGASRPIRASGLLGISAGKWIEPSGTITDFKGDSFSIDTLADGAGYTEILTSYVSADRGYEDAELEAYDIAGALDDANGVPSVFQLALPMVTSATQAQRLQKIEANRVKRQVTVDCWVGPEHINLISGGNTTLSIGTSPFDRWNGVYDVQSTNPTVGVFDEGSGAAMRNQISMLATGPEVYDWNPATDEKDVDVPDFDAFLKPLTSPSGLSALFDNTTEINTGSGIIETIEITFTPANTELVDYYELQYRDDVTNAWVTLPSVSPESEVGGVIKANVYPIVIGRQYDIRVRNAYGTARSSWEEVINVSVVLELSTVVATAGTGEINFTGTTPAIGSFDRLRVYRSIDSTFANAVRIGSDSVQLAGSTFDVDFATISGNAFFWIAPISTTGLVGEKSGPYERLIL